MKLSAPHYEVYRFERLTQLAKNIAELPVTLTASIDTLEDHEGLLYVYWDTMPSQAHMGLIESEWFKMQESQIVHIISGKETNQLLTSKFA